jgi:hypothetical protein
MDLISEINTGRRRSIVDAIEDPIAKPESTSQGRGVPKGSERLNHSIHSPIRLKSTCILLCL